MRLATLFLLLAPLASAQTAHFSDATSTIEVSGETQIGTASTYEAVIYVPADTGTSGIIYNEWTDGTEDKLLQLNFSTAGPSFLVGYGFPNGPGVLLGEAVVSTDAWHHIAYVYDGAEERHYLDGVLVVSRPQSGDVGDGAGLARLGGIARDGTFFRSFAGYLDALRISDVARYSGPSFTPPIGDLPSDDDTILLFNFNEPAGSPTVQDESPLGRTGTLGVGFDGATAPALGVVPGGAPSPALPADAHTLALFTFDGTHADTTFDVSGNGHHALNDGTTSVPGRHGHARQFDGVDDRIDMDTVREALQGTDAWTIEYIARSEAGGSIPTLLSHTCRNGWRLQASGTTVRYSIKVNTSGACTWRPDETLSIPTIGADWHYFALVFGDGSLRMYMDGSLLSEQPASGHFEGTGGPRAWIGHSDFSTGAYYSGYADELRVSTVARPADEICSTSSALGWACVVVANEGPPGGALALSVAPNPSHGAVRLGYSLVEAGTVRLAVYDALGREVALFVDGPRPAGEHEEAFDTTALPAGVYLLRLRTEASTLARPLTVVR